MRQSMRTHHRTMPRCTISARERALWRWRMHICIWWWCGDGRGRQWFIAFYRLRFPDSGGGLEDPGWWWPQLGTDNYVSKTLTKIIKNVEKLTYSSFLNHYTLLQSIYLASSYSPLSKCYSFFLMRAATAFNSKSLVYHSSKIFRIYSMPGLKFGLGVSRCLISFYILGVTVLLYFTAALTMLNFPSSWKGWNL